MKDLISNKIDPWQTTKLILETVDLATVKNELDKAKVLKPGQTKKIERI